MNKQYDDPRVLLAQAIWLCDYCRAMGCYQDLILLLPENAPSAESVTGIRYFEIRHHYKITDAAVCLLANRNGHLREDFERVIQLVRYWDEKIEEQLIEPFTQNIRDIKKMAEKLGGKRLKLLGSLPSLLSLPKEKACSIIGKRGAKLVRRFGEGDPYSLCAAYLFMEKAGTLSDYEDALITGGLVYAISLLPWGRPNQWFYPRVSDWPEQPDYSPMKVRGIYTKKDDDGLPTEDNITSPEKMNFAQLVYCATGYVMPRFEGISEEFVEFLMDIGISEITAHEVAAIAAATGKDGIQNDGS